MQIKTTKPPRKPAPAWLAAEIEKAAALGASDIHIAFGQIYRRQKGQLEKLPQTLDHFQEKTLFAFFASLISADETTAKNFRERGDVDLSLAFGGINTRANIYRTNAGYELALRLLPKILPTLEDLGLSEIGRRLDTLNTGLCLVTGRTGSGKSTTLAALLTALLKYRPRHAITLEDPIEYIFSPPADNESDISPHSLVSQREKGRDFSHFSQAIHAALREMPDIILIGEIRDALTLGAALRAAETGVIVLASLHTPTAKETVERIAGFFPPAEREAILFQLANSLEAVIAQTLIPALDSTAPNGRIAAPEILVATLAVKNLIRSGQTAQIDTAILSGSKSGMTTLRQSVKNLVERGLAPRSALEDYDKQQKLREK